MFHWVIRVTLFESLFDEVFPEFIAKSHKNKGFPSFISTEKGDKSLRIMRTGV